MTLLNLASLGLGSGTRADVAIPSLAIAWGTHDSVTVTIAETSRVRRFEDQMRGEAVEG